MSATTTAAAAAAAATTESKDDVLRLFITDSCPYAHRAWISALEKEVDPAHPVKSIIQQVSLFGDKKEILAVGSTVVPCGCHCGLNFSDSMPFSEYISEALPGPSLLPATPARRFRMRQLIAKHDAVPAALFGILGPAEVEARAAALQKSIEAFKSLQSDIEGPFLLGAQFTLADIAFFTPIERLRVVANAHVPELKAHLFDSAEFKGLNAWFDAVAARPSVAITRADRTAESLALQPFESKTRDAYLAEVYEGLAQGGMAGHNWARSKYAIGKPGQRAYTRDELLAAFPTKAAVSISISRM